MNAMARVRAMIVVATAVLASGCAQQLNRIETRVDEMAREQRQVAARQDGMARDLASLQAALDEEGITGQERRAELQSRLEAIDRNVERLLAQHQEQQSLLLRMRATLDVLERESTGLPATGRATTDPPAQETRSAPPGSGSSGREVFDAAFADFTRGTYSLAREGFQEVLSRFPDSELADDAAYWIAETYYMQGDYTTANQQFARILQRYPRGDTLAPALLKMGYCELELGNQAKATQLFRRLKDEYPQSDEAMIAEHKLSTLRGSP